MQWLKEFVNYYGQYFKNWTGPAGPTVGGYCSDLVWPIEPEGL